MDDSRGDWIQTWSGRVFYPTDPRPEDVYIEDIAEALSKLCRFGGHCLRYYSVAEHCVLVAEAAEPCFRLAALLHDAAEAYLVDVPRPVKHQLAGYAAIEDRLMAVISEKFGVSYPMSPEVKRLDDAVLVDEVIQNMAPCNLAWKNRGSGLGVTLRFLSPEEARREFLRAFYSFSKQP